MTPHIAMTFLSMQFELILEELGLMLVAFILALPCALDREKESRSAGLRTLPLVAIGACGFLLVGESFLEERGDNARLMQGLIGGLGFLGGGAILKGNNGVVGMASAVTIWITGAIGMAVAYRRFEIALLLSLLNFLTLFLGTKVKKEI